MKIILVCIGTELLIDKRNTNITFIAERLTTLGLPLTRQVSVGDEREELAAVFHEAVNNFDLIISTGGLGPTFDDLTREVVAQVLSRKLIFNRTIMHEIAAHFIHRGLSMPKENESQAYLIEGAEYITNKNGTAPGQIITLVSSQPNKKVNSNWPGKVIILLPGPPNEMVPMLENNIVPFLKDKIDRQFRKSLTLHIFGKPESEIDQRIRGVVEIERRLEGHSVTFGILAHRSIIDVKVSVDGKDELIVDETVRNLRQELYDAIGSDVYGENQQTLESVVGDLLLQHKKSLAVAESCTGGFLAHRITNIPSSSIYFRQSVVVYTNQSKINLLDVKQETINRYGAVSAEIALEMVQGIKKVAQTDCAVSLTGIAGPGGATETKPVGLVYIGIMVDGQEYVYEERFTGTRTELKDKFVSAALNYLRINLKK